LISSLAKNGFLVNEELKLKQKAKGKYCIGLARCWAGESSKY
jgi:hypothetical protein